MKRLMKISSMLICLQLSFSGLTAQSVTDSSIQKMIAGERAFYETLGKIYPAESSVTVTESSILGVKTYWFNQDLTSEKHIVIYLHGGMYALGSINSYRALLTHLSKKLNLPVI